MSNRPYKRYTAKCWFFALFLLTFSYKVFGQNPVPNPSFELYTNCPTGLSQVVNHCVGWGAFTSGTPDYYNVCGSGNVGVPLNQFGYQAAAYGQAYVGFYTMSGPTSNYKEYVRASLTSVLKIGATYQVDMSISLADTSGNATDDIGAWFCNSCSGSVTSTIPITPQISYSSYGPIANKTGWTRVTRSFIADSAYANIIIGGFKDYSSMGITTMPTGLSNTAYYYIDSIFMQIVSNIYFNYPDSLLCVGDTLTVPYSVNVSSYFNSNNVFSLQLSDSGGNFSNPTIIAALLSTNSGTLKGVVPSGILSGTNYRIRVVSSSPVDSSISNLKKIAIGNAIPTVPQIITNSPVCQKDALYLNSYSNTPGVRYVWSGPLNFSSTQQNTGVGNVSTAASGKYIVTAILYGCKSKDSVMVTVNPLPASSITATSNSSICAADTLKLFSTNTLSGTVYSWTGPNNFTAATRNCVLPNAAASASGIYSVTATLNGCFITDTLTAVVKSLPQSPIGISNSPLCTGDTLFLNVASPASLYSWAGPGNFASNAQSPWRTNVSVSEAGKYYITAYAGSGCSLKDSIMVIVYASTPTPVITSNSPTCLGGTLNLSVLTIPGATYKWTGPNNFFSIQQLVAKTKMSQAEAGIYSVTAKVNGCISQPAVTPVSVLTGPSVSLYANPGSTICAGASVALVAIPTNIGAGATYEWYKNGGFTGSTNISYIATGINTGDSFYVVLKAVSGCNTPIASNSVTMTVLPQTPAPVATITAIPGTDAWQGLNVNFNSSLSNGGTNPAYQWKKNGVNITGATLSKWNSTELKDRDTICLYVMSSDVCAIPKGTLSNCLIMNMPTNVNTIADKPLIELFPNPNNGQFYLRVSGTHVKAGNLMVSNIEGQKIIEYDIRETITFINLPEGLNAGVYIGRIQQEDGRITTLKIIVNR
jgi:hypothetical protein